ncbi:phosphopantetheine-binding protein [Streptomyces sp. NPDC051561]|uniref:phosphopantetheine-binding protein n=1 Tax=Streptomyces sp. NPDC051561 TaxID=3365658 RepID=UPI0037A158C9
MTTTQDPAQALHTELTAMLAAVGLDPALGEAAFERTFDALGLDSLARVELASRIKSRFGVDIEEQIEPESTPADIEELIGVLPTVTV